MKTTKEKAKNISIPLSLYNRINLKAKRTGVDFLRYLELSCVKKNKPEEYVEFINDPEIVESVGKSLDDIAKGRYVTIKTNQELRDYLKKVRKSNVQFKIHK